MLTRQHEGRAPGALLCDLDAAQLVPGLPDIDGLRRGREQIDDGFAVDRRVDQAGQVGAIGPAHHTAADRRGQDVPDRLREMRLWALHPERMAVQP